MYDGKMIAQCTMLQHLTWLRLTWQQSEAAERCQTLEAQCQTMTFVNLYFNLDHWCLMVSGAGVCWALVLEWSIISQYPRVVKYISNMCDKPFKPITEMIKVNRYTLIVYTIK